MPTVVAAYAGDSRPWSACWVCSGAAVKVTAYDPRNLQVRS